MPTVRDVLDFMLEAEARMRLFYQDDSGTHDVYNDRVRRLGIALKREHGRRIPPDGKKLGPNSAAVFAELRRMFHLM